MEIYALLKEERVLGYRVTLQSKVYDIPTKVANTANSTLANNVLVQAGLYYELKQLENGQFIAMTPVVGEYIEASGFSTLAENIHVLEQHIISLNGTRKKPVPTILLKGVLTFLSLLSFKENGVEGTTLDSKIKTNYVEQLSKVIGENGVNQVREGLTLSGIDMSSSGSGITLSGKSGIEDQCALTSSGSTPSFSGKVLTDSGRTSTSEGFENQIHQQKEAELSYGDTSYQRDTETTEKEGVPSSGRLPSSGSDLSSSGNSLASSGKTSNNTHIEETSSGSDLASSGSAMSSSGRGYYGHLIPTSSLITENGLVFIVHSIRINKDKNSFNVFGIIHYHDQEGYVIGEKYGMLSGGDAINTPLLTTESVETLEESGVLCMVERPIKELEASIYVKNAGVFIVTNLDSLSQFGITQACEDKLRVFLASIDFKLEYITSALEDDGLAGIKIIYKEGAIK